MLAVAHKELGCDSPVSFAYGFQVHAFEHPNKSNNEQGISYIGRFLHLTSWLYFDDPFDIVQSEGPAVQSLGGLGGAL